MGICSGAHFFGLGAVETTISGEVRTEASLGVVVRNFLGGIGVIVFRDATDDDVIG